MHHLPPSLRYGSLKWINPRHAHPLLLLLLLSPRLRHLHLLLLLPSLLQSPHQHPESEELLRLQLELPRAAVRLLHPPLSTLPSPM